MLPDIHIPVLLSHVGGCTRHILKQKIWIYNNNLADIVEKEHVVLVFVNEFEHHNLGI